MPKYASNTVKKNYAIFGRERGKSLKDHIGSEVADTPKKKGSHDSLTLTLNKKLVNLIVALLSQAKKLEFCTALQDKKSKCGKARLRRTRRNPHQNLPKGIVLQVRNFAH